MLNCHNYRTFIFLFCCVGILFAKPVFSASVDVKAEVTPYYLNFANSNNEALESQFEVFGGLELSNNKNFFNWKVHLEGFAASYSESSLAVPELYLERSYKNHEVRIGRSYITVKPFVDEEWQLGVQAAYLRFNPFNRTEQGRTGFNYIYQDKDVFFDFNVSPISIPDQGSGFQVNQGVFSSDSPWFVLPPQYLNLDTGARLNLNYEILNDSVINLINDYQFGGSLGITTENMKLFGMYSNRPSKQLTYLAQAKIRADEVGKLSVQVSPEFKREHFFGLQMENTFDSVTLKNGFYSTVLDKDLNEEYPYQSQVYEYFFITNSIKKSFNNFDVALYHLWVNRKEVTHSNIQFVENKRFLFDSALKLGFENFNFFKTTSDVMLTYFLNERIAQFQFKLGYNYNKKLNLFTQLNLMERINELEQYRSQISSFTFLDTISFGASYVF